MKLNFQIQRGLAVAFGVWLATLAVVRLNAGESPEAVAAKQHDLIGILKSDAKKGDKAVACKRLAVYGNDEAVPVLAPLIADPELASWARIALEAIPGPVADQALRDYLDKVTGRLLVGTINSIGVRRDAQAIPALAAKLSDADAQVASAAAVALGRIGGDAAAKPLRQALATAPADEQSAVAEGCVRCAEHFLDDHNYSQARDLYDAVRQASVPKQKVREAIRGAILARQEEGLPLLLEQLQSPDRAFFTIGLQTARELEGPKVAPALAELMWQAPSERQVPLLLALADRGEAEAMPTALDAVRRGSPGLQLGAIQILEMYGRPSAVPALLDAAASPEARVAAAALAALSRLSGNDVDADLSGRIGDAQGKTRQVLLELAGQRNLSGALPAVLTSAEDPDPGIRGAAVRALGALGNEDQFAELARLWQKTSDEKGRGDLETALRSISSRRGAECVPKLLPLARSGESSLRLVSLRALASAGGPDALAAVRAATEDQDGAVQEEAVRTLSTWPNTWPEDEAVLAPLQELAKSASKPTYQVLALRGCLQFLQGDRKLGAADKAHRLNEMLPLLKRPEEKRQAIAVLHGVRTPETLDILAAFASEPAVAEEACAEIVNLAAGNSSELSNADRQKALQAVLAHCANDRLKEKAQAALKGLPQ